MNGNNGDSENISCGQGVKKKDWEFILGETKKLTIIDAQRDDE